MAWPTDLIYVGYYIITNLITSISQPLSFGITILMPVPVFSSFNATFVYLLELQELMGVEMYFPWLVAILSILMLGAFSYYKHI